MTTFCQNRARKNQRWFLLQYSYILLVALFSLSACASTGAQSELAEQSLVPPTPEASSLQVADQTSEGLSASEISPEASSPQMLVSAQTVVSTPKGSPAQGDMSTTTILDLPQQPLIPAIINVAECTAGLNGHLLTVRAGEIFLYDNGIVTEVALDSGATPAPSAGAQPESIALSSPLILLNSQGDTTSLLMVAYQQTGRPFKKGAKAPKTGFDSVGFTRWVYAQKGVRLPVSAQAQANGGREVVREELRPGDLLVYKNSAKNDNKYHVGIYTGHGNFLHTTAKTGVVTEAAAFGLQFLPYFVSGRRYYDDPKAMPLSDTQKMAATSKAVKLALAELGPNDKLKRPKIVPRKKK